MVVIVFLATVTAATAATLVIITAATGILDEEFFHGICLLSVKFMRNGYSSKCVPSDNSSKPALEVFHKKRSNSGWNE
jgi:hypothetical protein